MPHDEIDLATREWRASLTERLRELAQKIDLLSAIESRVTRLETQLYRIVADMESEKDTRSRAHDRLDARITEVERTIWKATGVLVGAFAIVQFLIRFIGPK